MPEVTLTPNPEPSVSVSRGAKYVFGPGEWPFEKPHYEGRAFKAVGTEPWEVTSVRVTYVWSFQHDEWRVSTVIVDVVNIKKDGSRGLRTTNYDIPREVRLEGDRLANVSAPTSVVTVDEEF